MVDYNSEPLFAEKDHGPFLPPKFPHYPDLLSYIHLVVDLICTPEAGRPGILRDDHWKQHGAGD